MALNSNALVSVADLVGYIGDAQENVELFSIYHASDGGAVLSATAEVTNANTLVLISTTTTETIDLSTEASLTSLETTVEALTTPHDWVMTVQPGKGLVDPDGALEVKAIASALLAPAAQFVAEKVKSDMLLNAGIANIGAPNAAPATGEIPPKKYSHFDDW
ncbi:hypothetical protein LCGC14_3086640, partial [marine sediment metagenome]